MSSKSIDKSRHKQNIANQSLDDQIEDLVHLQEKKKKLNRNELFKKVQNES